MCRGTVIVEGNDYVSYCYKYKQKQNKIGGC